MDMSFDLKVGIADLTLPARRPAPLALLDAAQFAKHIGVEDKCTFGVSLTPSSSSACRPAAQSTGRACQPCRPTRPGCELPPPALWPPGCLSPLPSSLPQCPPAPFVSRPACNKCRISTNSSCFIVSLIAARHRLSLFRVVLRPLPSAALSTRGFNLILD